MGIMRVNRTQCAFRKRRSCLIYSKLRDCLYEVSQLAELVRFVPV